LSPFWLKVTVRKLSSSRSLYCSTTLHGVTSQKVVLFTTYLNFSEVLIYLYNLNCLFTYVYFNYLIILLVTKINLFLRFASCWVYKITMYKFSPSKQGLFILLVYIKHYLFRP
jgi:hypothetical protein